MGRQCALHRAHTNTRRQAAGRCVHTPFPPNLSRIPAREEPQGTQEMEGAESLDRAHRNYGSLPTTPVWPTAVALTLSTPSRLKTSRSGQGDNRTAEQEALPNLPDQGSALSGAPDCKCSWRQGVLRRPRVSGSDGGRDEEKREQTVRGCLQGPSSPQSPSSCPRREKELTKNDRRDVSLQDGPISIIL